MMIRMMDMRGNLRKKSLFFLLKINEKERESVRERKMFVCVLDACEYECLRLILNYIIYAISRLKKLP